ncbi:DUF4912 domain-containing protein [Oceanivirga miroungae]|uniref:DUF4912 domain-containing protein n=1 Tax=Oceanivirga miroungae TaxID=1130046 RepID=A0A6I8M7U8_9FUSO|nr:DUF4912 domain-containing protein [Oceanivirga miroungae]VWL85570.1 hypothetical protein OMES3154_00856 [Oceanivirga miroungae]
MFFRNFRNRKINTRFEERVRRRKPYLKYRNAIKNSVREYRKYDMGEDIYFDRAPLPDLYYVNEITLLPKNITTVFAFWEIREDSFNLLKEKHNVSDDAVIMLYKNEKLYRKISGLSRFGSYYINNVEGDKNYVAKIGFMDSNNNFYELSESSEVVTPSGKVSKNRATKWAIPKFVEGKIAVDFYTKDNLPEDRILAMEITDAELVLGEMFTHYIYDEEGNLIYIGASDKLMRRVKPCSSKM